MIPFQTPLVALLIGICVGASGAWYVRGVMADNAVLAVENAYQQQVIKQQQVIDGLKTQAQAVANQTEQQSREDEKRHNDEINYYRRLIREHGGLYDNGSTTSGSNATGNTSSTQGTTSGNPLSGEANRPLSEEATEFLLNQANLADRVVDQYLGCQRYVLELERILGEDK